MEITTFKIFICGGISSDIRLEFSFTVTLIHPKYNMILNSFSGHFGSVYKGFLTIPNEKGDLLVAVKTLHRE